MKHYMIFCALLLGNAWGCKKSSKTTMPDFDIIITGDPTVEHNIIVTSNVSQLSGISYLWDFGDGNTSTDEGFTHAYNMSQTYTITLTLNNNPLYKKTKTVFINPNYSFNMAGVPIPGENVSFPLVYTQLPGCNYLWDFGDGTTSTDAAPSHIYADSGKYNVTLLVNNDSTHSSKKTIAIVNDPVYTHNIQGTKHWHGNRLETLVSTTTATVSDTIFIINYINAVTIAIATDTLKFDPTLSSSSVLNYSNSSTVYSPYITSVSFNNTKDSIGYYRIFKYYPSYSGPGHHPGITVEYKLHTP